MGNHGKKADNMFGANSGKEQAASAKRQLLTLVKKAEGNGQLYRCYCGPPSLIPSLPINRAE